MGRCSLSHRQCLDLVGLRQLAAMEEHALGTTMTSMGAIMMLTDMDLEAVVEAVGGSRCTQAVNCQARSH